MNESFLEMFFRYTSKIIIIIPVFIIVAAVIIKGVQKNDNIINIQPTPKVNIASAKTEKSSMTSLLKESTIAAKLKIKGTFVCDINDTDKKIHLLVDNKQAYVEYISSTINMIGLLNKDCFYSWDKKTLKGNKTCNLGVIISMIENSPIIDLLNNPIVSSAIKGREEEVLKLITFCKDSPKPNQSVFYIPTNVVFKEK